MKSKELIWCADALDKLSALPPDVKRDFGFALRLVQRGEMPPTFEPVPTLGPGMIEIKTNSDGETYRAFYVAKFPEGIYVLDAIHKKSKRGKQLPQQDARRIRARYKDLLAERKAAGL